MFLFLPSLALRVRLSPIGREDEMERRVNEGRSLDNAKQLPLKKSAGSFSLGEKVRMRAFYENLDCQFHF